MTPTRAVLLLRISYKDREDAVTTEEPEDDAGRWRAEMSKGIGRQEEDGRELAARLGWTITKVVPEDDTSAFKRRKTKLPDGTTALRTIRPGFRAVLDLLASGECDGLIADDLDRVARDPRDLEDLIDVVESRRPHIPVESVTGSLRLANDADITMARIMCAVANKSSRDTSRRVSRKHEELAAEGKPGGGGFRGYGYDRRNLEVVPEEAEIVKEIAARVLGTWDGWTEEQQAAITPELGESLNSIADDLQARKVPTITGAAWNARSVRSVVTKPRIAGLRAHRGEVVGEAVWPAILDREPWEEVCARLAARGRHVDITLKRWLTGVLRCSQCGHMLTGAHGNGGTRYWCATTKGGCGKISVKAEPSEEEVGRQVLDLLALPDVLARLRMIATSETTEVARAELVEDEAQLKVLAGMWARKEVSFAEYGEARRIIEKRVKESRALITSAAPRVLRRLLAGDVRQGWARLTPADKREVVLALVPGYRVLAYDVHGPRRFDPARLVPLESVE
jgi:DNA invertase Pin-like site-specific DNA recombinase